MKKLKQKWVRQENNADNLPAAIANLFDQLDIRVTRSTLQETLLTHPYFPSLATAKDALEEWDIEAEVIQCGIALLEDIPYPAIAHLHQRDGYFVVLQSVDMDKETLTYIDPEEGWIVTSLKDFEKIWSSVLLLVEPGENSGEAKYEEKRKRESMNNISRKITAWGAGGVMSVILLSVGISFTHSFDLMAFWAAKVVGLIFSILLALNEFSTGKNFLRRICPSGPKINCQSVLKSKASRLFGGISMTDLGLFYFIGGLGALSLAVLGNQGQTALWLLGILTISTLPYTLFSLYYQAHVLKTWCWMCVGVQAVFWAEFLFVRQRLFSEVPVIGWDSLLLFGTAFLVPALIWRILKPALQQAHQASEWKNGYLRLKRHPDLIYHQLIAEKRIIIPTFSEELRLGSSKAPYQLTLVTNPRCQYCAEAHKNIRQLYHRFPDRLSVNIFFLIYEKESLEKELAKYVLALAMNNKKEEAFKTLDHWFNNSLKTGFRDGRFPFEDNEYNALADKRLESHLQWAQLTKIRGTPSFFLNNRRLPQDLHPTDLEYFFKYNENFVLYDAQQTG